MPQARAHIIISGMVQGVFFRAYTKEEADRLGLAGLVKNRWDGTVEVVLEGDKDKIDSMVSWCYKGPSSARVENVQVEWQAPTGEYDSFFVDF